MDSRSTSTGNPTTEEQIVAILRRSESHAHSQIASLNNTVQKLSIENGNLQRANEGLKNIIQKLDSMVQELKSGLTIAHEDNSRSDGQLKWTETHFHMLLEQKENNVKELKVLIAEIIKLRVSSASRFSMRRRGRSSQQNHHC